jgi:hypothetical protein
MDASGEVVDVSGEVVGEVVDVSGEVVGEVVDVSGEVVGEVVDVSGEVVGEVVDVSGEVVDAPAIAVVPTPPPQITLADILAATELIQQKETQDKSALESIGTISFEALRVTLIQWGKSGFRNAFPLYSITVFPPDTCSDGVVRSLSDYVTFVTGKTMAELIAPLQARCPEFVISFATTGAEILVVVSRV